MGLCSILATALRTAPGVANSPSEIDILRPESATSKGRAAASIRWDELLPAEQTRILRLLVGRIAVAADGIELRLHAKGIHSLVAELSADASAGNERPEVTDGAA